MAAPQRSLMMEIEIKFGKGRSDRVKVHYDDDADLLAEEFVRQHRLKEASKPVIAEYISKTMQDFLNQPRRLSKDKRVENHLVPAAPEETPLIQPNASDNTARFSPHPTRTNEYFPPENVRTPPLASSSRLSRPSSFRSSTSDVAEPSSGVDETDLLSHISRSLSMSMDYKQYQDSVDRRMNMRNFSLKEIASEVAVLTKEPLAEQDQSVDSDSSTVAATKPPPSSVHEAPTIEHRPDSESSQWSGASGIGYHHSEPRRSSGRYAPLSKETIDDLARGTYMVDNWPDLSPKSRNHLGSRDSTAHVYGDNNSDCREEATSVVSEIIDTYNDNNSEVSEGLSAEEMYNRLKMNSKHAPVQASHINNYTDSNGWPATTKVLKPSSSTMQLGVQRSSLSSHQASAASKTDNKSLVGKSANERLYNAAQLDRDKRSRRAKFANDLKEKELVDGKFKLNHNSQKIVANLRPKGYDHLHIGERLHVEGVVEKQLKNKRAEDLQGKLTPEEWSCAKCGTFQTIVRTSAVIQPLHQMQNKAYIQNNTTESNESKEKPMVCKQCGWNQSAVQAHRPVNIALVLNEDSEELLRSRWQGNGPAPEDGGIHQYLYENARTRENIQQLNRVLWNEAHSGLTFAPSLPEASKELLDKYRSTNNSSAKTITTLGSSLGFSDTDGVSPSPPSSGPVGLNKSNKNIIAGPAIGEYLSKSATERLSTTQTRPVVSSFPRPQDSPHRGETDTQTSAFRHADQNQFTNRLVYEYKDKRERQQKQIEFSSKHDVNTGEALFQPKVGPDPDEALGFGATSHKSTNGPKRNVFEDIILKDKLLKKKKKEAEEKAVAQSMKAISEKQVKALESSHQILQQSTQNNIEELFQVLLEAQQHIIQDSNHSESTSTKGSSEPEWKSYLVDLDLINTEMMIAEVGLLLNEVRAFKLNRMQHSAPSSKEVESENGGYRAENATQNMLVSFESFRKLVLKCMKRRDGTGRSYVYVPKKKADVTMQMIQNDLKEETFQPKIDKNSISMSLRRHKDLSDYPIEDVLQVEGERIRSKWENARQARILQDSRELTFKPKLFKPPSYVKPKYWGMEVSTAASDSEDEPEPTSQPVNESGEFNLTHAFDRELEQQREQEDQTIASSAASSEAEPRVLQMPALQNRPATSIPLPAEVSADSRTNGGYTNQQPQHQNQRPPQVPHHHTAFVEREGKREISPVRRDHHSPSSRHSDEHSVNTISTTFTNDNDDLPEPSPSGRSVSSAAPLVSRRFGSTGSALSKSSAQTPGSTTAGPASSRSMSNKSRDSITRKAVVLNKPPRVCSLPGKPDGPAPMALPLLPHELMQNRGTPGNSGKSYGSYSAGRVSDASELTSGSEQGRPVKQR